MSRGTALVVDAGADSRRLVVTALATAGFAVIQAGDGPEALDRVAGRRDIRLIVTDADGPGLDGIGLIAELRASPTLHFTPILLLTDGAESQKRRGRAAGATGWVGKPVGASRLMTAVGRLCG